MNKHHFYSASYLNSGGIGALFRRG